MELWVRGKGETGANGRALVEGLAVIEPQGGEHGAMEEGGERVRDGVAKEVEDSVQM